MKKFLLGIIVVASMFVVGCKDGEDQPKGDYEKGVFVVSEGAFQAGNASIAFKGVDVDSVKNEIFKTKNGRPLGDTGQSMAFFNDKGFIVVNNSNKVEVVNANTFEELATVTNFESPRYFLGINANKAYVSQWGSDGKSGKIKILNPSTHEVTGEIDVEGNGPEKLKLIDGKVYVSYSGGLHRDSFITVINPTTDAIEKTIPTHFNPSEITQGQDGNIWVLSGGYTNWTTMFSTPPRLQVFDKNDHTLVKELELGASSSYPGVADLQQGNGNYLFFSYNKGLHKVNTASSTIALEEIVGDKPFTAITYDASENLIYATTAPTYTGAGTLNIYKTDGTEKSVHTVGVVPGYIIVK